MEINILECIEKHYKKDCEHVWNGPMKKGDDFQTVTCSKCGMSALSHGMQYGP